MQDMHEVVKARQRDRRPQESASISRGRGAEHRTLFLQRTIGSQVAQRMLQSGRLQAKLTISKPGDPFEREADDVADKVMRMAEPTSSRSSVDPTPIRTLFIQRKCATCEDELQRQPQNPHSETPNTGLDTVSATLPQSGRPLDPATRSFFEPRFGVDFSAVRIHTDTQAAESARSVNALAYTVGSNVVFNSGQYLPQSSSGRRLLAHES